MTTVMVNGSFDVLHPGHVALLNTARSYGDCLVVAIDTDRRVKELKGEQRPINCQTDRRIMLSALKAVDIVEFFDSTEDLIRLMEQYKPDVYEPPSDMNEFICDFNFRSMTKDGKDMYQCFIACKIVGSKKIKVIDVKQIRK